MKNFFIYEKDFEGATFLTARAGTNGFQGGDAGHGGQAVIDLINRHGGGFEFIRYKTDNKIRIIAAGDSEIKLLLEALEWVCGILRNELNFTTPD